MRNKDFDLIGNTEIRLGTHKRRDWYWKVEPIRRFFSRWSYRFSDPHNWFTMFMWDFVCGNSVVDSIYYNIWSPNWLKRLVRKLSRYVYF